MTRIIAGAAGGRRLAVPPNGTRPTTDRVREAVFNLLAARRDFTGLRVLDLFAGSGEEVEYPQAGEIPPRGQQVEHRLAHAVGGGTGSVGRHRKPTAARRARDDPRHESGAR